MPHPNFQLPIRILLSALIAFVPFRLVEAESTKVTAVLSNSEVSVGQAAQMQIRVTGGKEANTPAEVSVGRAAQRQPGGTGEKGGNPPGEINVEGFEFPPTGTSPHVEVNLKP